MLGKLNFDMGCARMKVVALIRYKRMITFSQWWQRQHFQYDEMRREWS